MLDKNYPLQDYHSKMNLTPYLCTYYSVCVY